MHEYMHRTSPPGTVRYLVIGDDPVDYCTKISNLVDSFFPTAEFCKLHKYAWVHLDDGEIVVFTTFLYKCWEGESFIFLQKRNHHVPGNRSSDIPTLIKKFQKKRTRSNEDRTSDVKCREKKTLPLLHSCFNDIELTLSGVPAVVIVRPREDDCFFQEK